MLSTCRKHLEKMPCSVKFNFSNPSKTYSPEDTVLGNITLITDTPLSARSVKISWKGIAHVEKVEPSRKILGRKHLAWESSDNKNVMPPGTHIFPFSFKIPEDAEPSFSGDFGKIEYKMKVEIDRPHWVNSRAEEEFFVTNYKNGRRMVSEDQVNVKFQQWERSGGWRWRDGDGHVEMTITMKKLSFFPGDPVVAKVEIDNSSTKIISGLTYRLNRTIYYNKTPWNILPVTGIPYHKSHKEQRTMISNFQLICIPPSKKREFHVVFTVPPAIQPIFESPMISIDYQLVIGCGSGSNRCDHYDVNVDIAIRNPMKKI